MMVTSVMDEVLPCRDEWMRSGSLCISVSSITSEYYVGDVAESREYILRTLIVSNSNSHDDVVLHLSSRQPDIVSFQLSNSNINLKVANEAFNEINIINQITLCAGEQCNIVLRVLPSLTSIREKTAVASPNTQFNFKDIRVHVDAHLEGDKGDLSFDVLTRICRSSLSVDTCELLFHECALGASFIKELTVWNRSEIDSLLSLSFEGCVSSNMKAFSFIDYDTNMPISNEHPIAGFSHVHIRVIYRPTLHSIGECCQHLLVRNIVDRSATRLRIFTSVAAQKRAEGLRVTPATVEFGDCFRGLTYQRVIIMHNVAQRALDVRFASDISGGTVWFELYSTASEPDHDSEIARQTVDDANSDEDDFNDVKRVEERPVAANADTIDVNSAISHALATPLRVSVSADTLSSSAVANSDAIDQSILLPNTDDETITLPSGKDCSSAAHHDSSKYRIEELRVLAGQERHIRVCVKHTVPISGKHQQNSVAKNSTPKMSSRESSSEYDEQYDKDEDSILTSLQHVKFRIFMRCRSVESGRSLDKYSRTLLCTSCVCTSIVSISPSVLQFGNVSVGTNKVATFQLNNTSEISTIVVLRFSSTCLSAPKGPITLAPNSLLDVRVSIMPTSSCLDYVKQIRIVNLRNAADESILTARASIVDQSGAEFHALFYTFDSSVPLTTSYSGATSSHTHHHHHHHHHSSSSSTPHIYPNIVDFGNVVAHYPSVRRVSFTNLTSNTLKLQLGSSTPHELLFYRVRQSSSHTPSTPSSSSSSSSHTQSSRKRCEQRLLHPGSPRLRDVSPNNIINDIDDVDAISLVQKCTCNDELFTLLSEQSPAKLPWFQSASDERAFVESELLRMRAWQHAVTTERLIAVELLELAPFQCCPLLLVFRVLPRLHPHLRGKLRNIPASFSVRLVEAHADELSNWSPEMVGNVPMRQFVVQGKACRASFDFALSHINFGLLKNLNPRRGALVVSNNSDIALSYVVRKTGSIASDDVVLTNGNTGVLRPYQQREVPFEFRPSLAGRFRQTLTFQNVHDTNDRHMIEIKADIHKPFNFWLQSVELDLSYCLVGQRSRSRHLLLKNISERSRKFIMKSDTSSFISKVASIMFECGELSLDASEDEAKQRDEECEKLEAKLKIALRKKKNDKVIKINKRLQELTRIGLNDVSGHIDNDNDEVLLHKNPMVVAERSVSHNQVSITLPPNAVQKVLVTFVSCERRAVSSASNVSVSEMNTSKCGAGSRIEAIKGIIFVYEHNNKDYVREVSYYVRVCKDTEIHRQALERRLKLGSAFRSLYTTPYNVSDTPDAKSDTLKSNQCVPVRAKTRRLSNESITRSSKQFSRVRMKATSRSESSSPVHWPPMMTGGTIHTPQVTSPASCSINKAISVRVPRRFLFSLAGSSTSLSSQPDVSMVASKNLIFRIVAPNSIVRTNKAWTRPYFSIVSERKRVDFSTYFTVSSAVSRMIVIRWLCNQSELSKALDFEVRKIRSKHLSRRLSMETLNTATTPQTYIDRQTDHNEGRNGGQNGGIDAPPFGVIPITIVNDCIAFEIKCSDVIAVTVRFADAFAAEWRQAMIDGAVHGSIAVLTSTASISDISDLSTMLVCNTLPVRVSPLHKVLTVSPPIVLIGSSDHTASFNVYNTSSSCAARFIIENSHHSLRINASSVIDVAANNTIEICIDVLDDECRTSQPISIQLRDITNCQCIELSIIAVARSHTHSLLLTSLESSVIALKNVLNFGSCFAHNVKTFIKVAPIRVASCLSHEIIVSYRSNVPSEVALFMDETCTNSFVDGVTILPYDACTIFVRVCVQLDTTRVAAGQCRHLLAGLTFIVQRQSDGEQLDVLRSSLSCTIGDVVVDISCHSTEHHVLQFSEVEARGARLIDFGTITQTCEQLQATLSLGNNSTALPLRVRLASTSDVSITNTDGTLCPPSLDRSIAPHSSPLELSLTINNIARRGIVSHDIRITLLDIDIVKIVTLRYFVDPHILDVKLPIVSGYTHLHMDTMYIEKIPSSQSFKLHSAFANGSSFDVRNISSKSVDVHATLLGNTPGSISWISSSASADNTLCLPINSNASMNIALNPIAVKPNSPDFQQLVSGKNLNYTSRVILSSQNDPCLSVITLRGCWSHSLFTIEPSQMSVHRVGYDNNWSVVTCCVCIHNQSSCELTIIISSLPTAITLGASSSTTTSLNAFAKQQFVFELHPDRIEDSGFFSLPIHFLNKFNSFSSATFTVTGEIDGRVVTLSPLNDSGELMLPPLTLPRLSVDERIELINIKNIGVRCSLSLSVQPILHNTVDVRFLPSEASSLELTGGERAELRLTASVIPGSLALLTTLCARNAMENGKQDVIMVELGTISLHVDGLAREERIALKTELHVGATFTVSRSRIILSRTNPSDHFYVRNISGNKSFQFDIAIEDPKLVFVAPVRALVKPNTSVKVVIDRRYLESSEILEEQECSLRVIALDANDLTELFVKVALTADTLDTSNQHHITGQDQAFLPAHSSDVVPAQTRYLSVRGATAMSDDNDRYEINLGQQSVDKSRYGITWELALENLGDAPLEYFVQRVGVSNAHTLNHLVEISNEHNQDDKADWLHINRSGGVLERKNDSQTLLATLSHDTPGVLSTYLVIGTRCSVAELKIIRIEMEVVETFNDTSDIDERRFDVIVNGERCLPDSPSPIINLGDVFLQQYYCNRSFVISNLSTMPLNFVLSTGHNDSPWSQSSVLFSLSTTTLKLFRSLTVVAGGSATIFIHFKPMHQQSDAHDSELHLPIYVSCRLVKDYQVSIQFRANCIRPQITLSTRTINFYSRTSLHDGVLKDPLCIEPSSCDLVITNVSSQDLVVSLRNSSRVFSTNALNPILISAMNENIINSSHNTQIIAVTPIISELVRQRSFLRQDQYVEEHLTVYNKHRLSERFVVSLRFTTSELHVFYLSPGEKKGFAFGKIEQSIVVLMRKFELFFRPISEKLSNLNEAQTQTAKSQEREALLETTSENLLDLIASEEYTALYFDFFFVSDELVFYGLKGYVGHFVFQLANLLHMFVLNHRVFHFALKRCGRDRKSPLFHFVTQWFQHIHSFAVHFCTQASLASVSAIRRRLQQLCIRDWISVKPTSSVN